jgi:opacity protein-like surface antigen
MRRWRLSGAMNLFHPIQLTVALLMLAGASRASADLLAAATTTSIGASAASQILQGPKGGLGVFVSRWDSKDYGDLTGYGVRTEWSLYRQLGLEARASYLKSKEEHADTTLIPIELMLTWDFRLAKGITPYLGAGVGYYIQDVEFDDTTSLEDLDDQSAGYFALAGLNIHLGPVSFFGDAKYTLVGTDNDLEWRGSDVGFENSLDGLTLTAGLKIGF